MGVHNCGHYEDAGVRCPGNVHLPIKNYGYLSCKYMPANKMKVCIHWLSFLWYCNTVSDIGDVCNTGDIRLVGGSDQYEGRVEICINDQWGTVCDDSWGVADATVVCNQLGNPFSGRVRQHMILWCRICSQLSLPCVLGAIAYSSAYFGQGTGQIYMDDVACSGTESSLYFCPSLPLGNNNCGHYEDAGVKCIGTSIVHIHHLLQILHGFKFRECMHFLPLTR